MSGLGVFQILIILIVAGVLVFTGVALFRAIRGGK